MRPCLLATLLVLLTILAPAAAFSQQTGQESGAPSEVQTLPDVEPNPVRWKDEWHRVRPWQYPTTVGLTAFGFAARFAFDDPEPNWKGTIGIDQDILDAIAVRDDPWRQNVIAISDITFVGSIVYRAIDSTMVPGYFNRNWDVAWQMSWIDAQAFGTIAAVLWGTQLYVGRVRPAGANCDDPDRPGNLCNIESAEYARSFIAGHPATAIAAAGLTCLHHGHMPLYGGGLGDKIACGVMIGNAAVNSATRVMSEHHYPSDLLFGAVLGLTAGWVLPTALHYGWGDDDEDPAETARLPKEERDPTAPVFTLSPSLVDEQPGLMLLGRF